LKLKAKFDSGSLYFSFKALKAVGFNTGCNWVQPAPPHHGGRVDEARESQARVVHAGEHGAAARGLNVNAGFVRERYVRRV
jgi:hypothetical protein